MAGRSLAAGILAAVITLAVAVGGLSLSLAEAPQATLPPPAAETTATVSQLATSFVIANPTLTDLPTNTQVSLPTASATKTTTPSPTRTPTRTVVPSTTSTSTPAQTSTLALCAQPPGWITYVVVPGDFLAQIAYTHGITLSDLRRVNCLGRSSIIHPGDKLYVPSLPTPSLTPIITGTKS